MEILARLEKSKSCWFIIISSLVFFFLRFPSLFEPNWYGDEGIYQTLGIAMNSGRLLYRDIFDNKPPLLYFLYSLVNSDQFLIRLMSLVFGVLAIIIFYKLAEKVLNNPKASFISTLIFSILFGLPLIEGNIANAENFMLLPNIIAAFLVFKSIQETSQQKKIRLEILAGLIIGISFLFKVVAVFDFAAFFGFIFFSNYSNKFLDIFKKENLIKEIKNLAPFAISFFVPIILVTLFFTLNGALSYFLKAVLFNNVGYVGYGNKFIIPQGLLILKLTLLALFSAFLFYRRKILNPGFIFASLWLAFSVFDAFFSQRPYTHYVLVILPAFCLMVGFFLLNNKTSKLAGVIFISTLIAILLSFTFYVKTIFYYQNFVSFVLGQKTVVNYQSFFDGNTPNDYTIASFINLYAKKTDNIFIWGNNAQVYDLTGKLPPGRYTVAYHITSYKDGIENTNAMLNIKKPRFIVIMPNVSVYPFNLIGYFERMEINNIIIYEKIPY